MGINITHGLDDFQAPGRVFGQVAHQVPNGAAAGNGDHGFPRQQARHHRSAKVADGAPGIVVGRAGRGLDYGDRPKAEFPAQGVLQLLVVRLVFRHGNMHDAALPRRRQQPRHFGLGNLRQPGNFALAQPVHIVQARRQAQLLIRIIFQLCHSRVLRTRPAGSARPEPGPGAGGPGGFDRPLTARAGPGSSGRLRAARCRSGKSRR